MMTADSSGPKTTLDKDASVFPAMLQRARQGDREAVGNLLQGYVDYLGVIAKMQLDERLRRRVNPSDIVQETMLAAHREFSSFRGDTQPEMLGWLRAILINLLHRNFERHIKVRKRDVRREVSIDEDYPSVQGSRAILRSVLPAKSDSPSTPMQQRDRERELADRLSELKPDHARVISLRIVTGLSFEDIASEMNRSSGAVRMLWLRALDAFKKLNEDADGRYESH